MPNAVATRRVYSVRLLADVQKAATADSEVVIARVPGEYASKTGNAPASLTIENAMQTCAAHVERMKFLTRCANTKRIYASNAART